MCWSGGERQDVLKTCLTLTIQINIQQAWLSVRRPTSFTPFLEDLKLSSKWKDMQQNVDLNKILNTDQHEGKSH